MDYPHEILFSEKEMPGVVRLKVAAIAALLDHGSFENAEFSDAERLPFNRELIRKTADGKSLATYPKPQTFFKLEPTGHLAVAAKKVIDAMGASVQRNQLRTAFVRFDISGEVDPVNTWIRISDTSGTHYNVGRRNTMRIF